MYDKFIFIKFIIFFYRKLNHLKTFCILSSCFLFSILFQTLKLLKSNSIHLQIGTTQIKQNTDINFSCGFYIFIDFLFFEEKSCSQPYFKTWLVLQQVIPITCNQATDNQKPTKGLGDHLRLVCFRLLLVYWCFVSRSWIDLVLSTPGPLDPSQASSVARECT